LPLPPIGHTRRHRPERNHAGSDIPSPGEELVCINRWLRSGSAPLSGIGDAMVNNSFTFEP
jgi:hypothetical protein